MSNGDRKSDNRTILHTRLSEQELVEIDRNIPKQRADRSSTQCAISLEARCIRWIRYGMAEWPGLDYQTTEFELNIITRLRRAPAALQQAQTLMQATLLILLFLLDFSLWPVVYESWPFLCCLSIHLVILFLDFFRFINYYYCTFYIIT